MVLEKLFGQADQFMLDILKMVNYVDMVNLNQNIEFTKVNGRMIKWMVMDHYFCQMETHMLEYLRMIKCMGKVNLLGKMETNLLVNLIIIKKMVLVNLFGLIKINIKGNGKTIK